MKKNLTSPKTNYGLDAPYVVFGLFFGGVFYLALYIFLLYYNIDWLMQKLPYFLQILWSPWLFLVTAACYFIAALLMFLSSKFGKYAQAEKLLNIIQWRGDERVLDIGCGRGLLLIKAAQRLKTGKAIGIDIWNPKDLSGNTKEAVLHNATLENVSDKIEIVDGNACKLPFEDNFFDVIVSSLVIHNIPKKELREKALAEMVRVLKPQGIILLQDFKFIKEYQEYFRKSSHSVAVSPVQWLIFPPVYIVIVHKQGV